MHELVVIRVVLNRAVTVPVVYREALVLDQVTMVLRLTSMCHVVLVFGMVMLKVVRVVPGQRVVLVAVGALGLTLHQLDLLGRTEVHTKCILHVGGALPRNHALQGEGLIVCLSWIVMLIVGPLVMEVFIVWVVTATPMIILVVVIVVIVFISVLPFLALFLRRWLL